MNFTKLIGGIVVGVLGVGAALGIPGADSPETAALAEKVAASLSALLGGWLFFRQEWLGQGKQ